MCRAFSSSPLLWIDRTIDCTTSVCRCVYRYSERDPASAADCMVKGVKSYSDEQHQGERRPGKWLVAILYLSSWFSLKEFLETMVKGPDVAPCSQSDRLSLGVESRAQAVEFVAQGCVCGPGDKGLDK